MKTPQYKKDKPVSMPERGNLLSKRLSDYRIVGFTGWRRTMPEPVKAGVKASPHTWAWTPRSYYSAQLGAGVGNVVIAEGIPGGAPEIDYSAYRFDGKGNLFSGSFPRCSARPFEQHYEPNPT